ncbi:F-box/LRR-repeat protein At3g58930-like [Lolium rigidum]|uniref:F-box/LRR-repeat protein At3g58930-like n=2 Tax=Lolium rigidum TaxID=89674 RepID=UPI001F5C998F|nr:F-box/LRR-repeat protein At3g58930-like [Lolium rigidum]
MADKAVASGDDRISALPLDLRLRLLSLLPADEAVRSSELSREWRGLWKKMPSLRLVGLEQFETAEGFNEFVNHLIVLRGHLPLDKFEIQVRQSEAAVSYPYANLWIQYALICKVPVLDVLCEAGVVDSIQLTVPLVSDHLTTLNLCEVDLEKCSALVDSELSLDFSSCPLLKSLSMQRCSICVHKISSKSLEQLRITSYSSFNLRSRTWISAPSLISLELSDFVGEAPILESMPFLQKAFIRLYVYDGSWCDAINPKVQKCCNQSCERCYGYPVGGYRSVLLNGLSNAIYLELIADLNVYVYRRDLTRCPIFGNLKTLLLNEWCVAHGLHGLVCILQHSPILEKLTLLFYNTKGLPIAIVDDGNHDPVEQTFACAHLKVVNIKCQVMNDRVSKTLKLLSTCGIPPEHIRLKVNQSHPYSFSFDMPQDATPSTSDHDAAPSPTTED